MYSQIRGLTDRWTFLGKGPLLPADHCFAVLDCTQCEQIPKLTVGVSLRRTSLAKVAIKQKTLLESGYWSYLFIEGFGSPFGFLASKGRVSRPVTTLVNSSTRSNLCFFADARLNLQESGEVLGEFADQVTVRFWECPVAL